MILNGNIFLEESIDFYFIMVLMYLLEKILKQEFSPNTDTSHNGVAIHSTAVMLMIKQRSEALPSMAISRMACHVH